MVDLFLTTIFAILRCVKSKRHNAKTYCITFLNIHA